MALLLLILESAPYQDHRPQEVIELALTLAAFDRQVDILAVGMGILQLLTRQKPEVLKTRGIAPLLEMVDWYGLRQLFLEEEGLTLVASKELLLKGKPIPRREIPQLLKAYDLILRA